MDLLSKIKYDPGFPLAARTAGRALVGSLNFSISNLIQQHLRQQRFAATGAEPEEVPTIDDANDLEAEKAEKAEEQRTRAEQGFAVPQDPLDTASKLKLIRDAINADLLEHAARVPMATKPGYTLPDARHVGANFAESVHFQSNMEFRPNRAQAEAEATVLGRSVEEVLAAQMSNHEMSQRFMKEMVPDILTVYDTLTAMGTDGHALGLEDANAVFTKLPAINRERMVAKVDAALYRAVQTEVQRHLRKRPDAMGNIGLLEGLRREIRDAWTIEAGRPEVRKELKDSEDAGASRPAWAPAPPRPQQKAA
jgi:hypothetical protein